jgi:hypothetical protein
MKAKIMVSGILASLVFVSCTDFFTSSWGEWAARDPANLIRNVSAGNVDEYIEMAENNPGLSLELLKKINGAVGSASGSDKTHLQSAAVTAAVNASDFTNVLMNNVPDVSTLEDGDKVKELINDTLNSMGNLTSVSDTLTGVLEQDTTAFIDSASADDLAMAAALILAGEAKKTGTDIFSNYIPNSAPPGTSLALAEELAAAAMGKYEDPSNTSASTDSLLYDLLGKLNLV